MDFLHNVLLAAHIFGLALLVGPFFLQMRSSYGFAFPLMLTGASIQLVSGLALYGLQIADGDANHVKLGIKSLIGVAIFVASLLGFLGQRRLAKQKSGIQVGAATANDRDAQVTVPKPIGTGVASATDQSRLKPFFHIAGGLAVLNVLIATIWR